MKRNTILPVVLIAGLALAACGSDDQAAGGGIPTLPPGNTTQEGPDATTADPHELALNFANCMRSNGVEDYPDPEFSDTGEFQFRIDDKDDPDLQAASDTCVPLLNGIPGFGKTTDPAAIAAAQQRGLAFARCMRAEGFEVPDPVADGAPAATVDPALANTAAFADAAATCASPSETATTEP